jgi:serine protease AprX
MSTATVSGVVAQILQAKPGLGPDQVKYRLMSTARPIATTNHIAVGAGLIDAFGAATSSTSKGANGGLTPAAGLGDLQPARGSLSVEAQSPAGWVGLSAEYVAQGDPRLIDPRNPLGLVPFVSLTYSLTGWDPLTWNLTSWVTEDWLATAWDGTQWRATVWDGTQWRGTQWRNEDWTGTQWRYSEWDGTQWRATNWQSAWYAAAWD